MTTINNSSSVKTYILTILLPFVSLFFMFKNWRAPWAKNVFWIVCTYMGFVQIFQPEGRILGDGADGGRYVLQLIDMYYNVNTFSDVSSYFFDGRTLDIYFSTLCYLTSRFTNNGHVLFLIIAFIYGFFYSRNIWKILDYMPSKLKVGFWSLIALLFLICPIWNINGVRMWTALHVFVYGAMPYFLEKDKKKLWLSVISILIHHSFLFPVLLLFLYILFLNKLSKQNFIITSLFCIYLFSFTIQSLNITTLNSLLQSILPGYYDDRVDIYVNEETLESRLESSQALAWQNVFFNELSKYITQIFVIITYFIIKKNKLFLPKVTSLFVFSLLFYSFANIAALVPSGSRFVVVAQMFMVPVFLLVLTYFPLSRRLNKIILYLLYVLGFSLLLRIRVGFDFYSIMLVLGNFIIAPFIEINVPLIDYIKMIF